MLDQVAARRGLGMPAARPMRVVAVYVGGVLVPAALVVWILAGGERIAAGSAGRVPGRPGAFNIGQILVTVAVFVIATHLGGALANQLRQPRVIGQAAAGLVLGPSLLGQVAPHAERWLHGGGSDAAVDLLAQIGVIFFVFLVGRELMASRRAPSANTALARGATMTAVPLLAGILTAWFIVAGDRPAGVAAVPYALFIGLATATTALPVLAHILSERGLLTSRVGALATGAAVTGDAIVWCLLAVTICLARNTSLASTAVRLAVALGFVAVLWYGVRPLLARVLPGLRAAGPIVPAVLLASVFLCAEVTDALGLHGIFGAFAAGMIMPAAPVVRRAAGTVEAVTQWLLLPLFFAAVGSRTQLSGLGSRAILLQAAAILFIAVVSKFAAGAGTAWTLRMSWRNGLALGAMLNCRGLTELLILNLGLTSGLIGGRVFAMFVLTALVTTAMTGPVLARLRLPVADSPSATETDQAPAPGPSSLPDACARCRSPAC